MSATAHKLTVFRAFLVVLKWGLWGGVPLAGLYYVVHYIAMPVRAEIERPKGSPVAVDKSASPLVQAVQQTRLTIEKHDALVAEVGEVAGEAGEAKNAGPGQARRSVPARSTAGMSRMEAAVALLKVGAVIDGAPPRLLIEGRVVRPGDLVSEELGLTFRGLDAAGHAVLFVNRAGQVFRRSY